ncbi:Crp/Fnr family transcriptional regulator [Chloroflexota bacterium]
MLHEDIAQLTVISEFLQASPYFFGLSSSAIDSISKLIFEKLAGKGELIIREGEPGEALYFVASGAVKCFKTSEEGKEQILQIVLPGDSFNDAAVFDDGPNPASGEAMSSVVLYGITKRDMEGILQDNQEVVANAVRVLAGRIRHLLDLVEDLSFRRVTGRIARLLLEHVGDGSGSGPRLTQQEMAAAVGTAREVVGRSLKTLHEGGAIRMERNRLVIVNKEALVQMARSAA